VSHITSRQRLATENECKRQTNRMVDTGVAAELGGFYWQAA
jgi:hypothetical protein